MPTQEGKIKIVPYDSGWPGAFEAEAAGLRAALKTLALRIDHHGSTAIPGLGAKPIIDIQVSVTALQPLSADGTKLEAIGYIHVPHPTTPFVHFSIGQSSGRTVITCTLSKGADVRNDEHWRFATISVIITTWLASMKTSNSPWRHKS